MNVRRRWSRPRARGADPDRPAGGRVRATVPAGLATRTRGRRAEPAHGRPHRRHGRGGPADLRDGPGRALRRARRSTSIAPNPRQPRQVFDEEALAELVHSHPRDRPAAADRRAAAPGRRTGTSWSWASAAGGPPSEAGLDRDPGDRAGDRRRRHAARRAAGEPAPQPAQPAGGGRGLPAAAAGLRLHPRRAGARGSAAPARRSPTRSGCSGCPPPVQRRVAAGVLSAGHARALLALDDADAQERLAHRIVAEGLSRARGRGDRRSSVTTDCPSQAVAQVRAKRPIAPGLARSGRPALGPARDAGAGRRSAGPRAGSRIEFATLDDLDRIVDADGPGPHGTRLRRRTERLSPDRRSPAAAPLASTRPCQSVPRSCPAAAAACGNSEVSVMPGATLTSRNHGRPVGVDDEVGARQVAQPERPVRGHRGLGAAAGQRRRSSRAGAKNSVVPAVYRAA